MAYAIKIGEFSINNEDPECSFVEAKKVTLAEAPAFPNDAIKHTNSRFPGYSVWYDFCAVAGLQTLFYQDDQFRGGHPGYFELTQDHLNQAQTALTNYQLANNGKPPGFSPFMPSGMPSGFGKANNTLLEYDATLARLIWVEWWIRWALLNCSRPIVSNF